MGTLLNLDHSGFAVKIPLTDEVLLCLKINSWCFYFAKNAVNSTGNLCHFYCPNAVYLNEVACALIATNVSITATIC